MSLLDLFPQPRALPFAGGTVRVRPFTLGQLAELQGWLAELVPHPFEAGQAAFAQADPADLPALVAAAIVQADGWPVALGSRLGDILLSTPAGRRELARLALGDLNPGFDPAEALEASDEEWGALARVAYGVDPLASLVRLLDGPEEEPSDPADTAADPTPWGAIVADVVKETGWTLDVVAHLTPGQLATIRAGGERPEPALPVRAGESADETRRRHRELLGLGDEEPDAATDPAFAAELQAQLDLVERITNAGWHSG